MSLKNSQNYDINPFEEGLNDNINDVKTPLNPLPNQMSNGPKILPQWLQDNNSNQVPNPSIPLAQQSSPSNPSQDSLDPAVPRMILYTRVVNLVLSICMILTSVLALFTTQSMTTGVLACYVVIFACLLCCFETHLKQVSKLIALNFGFMYSAKSRCIFMLFLGSILFSFSLFGKLIGLCMCANAIFNFYILFKYPQFEEAQRNHAQSEIKDFLASNPAFSKQFFDASADILKSNPELAQQGAQAMFSAMSSSGASTPANDSRGNYTSV